MMTHRSKQSTEENHTSTSEAQAHNSQNNHPQAVALGQILFQLELGHHQDYQFIFLVNGLTMF